MHIAPPTTPGVRFAWAAGIEDTFIPQERPGLRALDEYVLTQHDTQWRADLERAASLGVTALRWGVPWYRVEPQPGVFDWSWIDQVLAAMAELGLDPIIDMMHYGTPLWLERSFDDPAYPELVARYQGAFAARYPQVRTYTPLNEPTVNAEFCGRRAEWPPYLSGDHGYVRVLLQLARGIQLSARAIRAANPDAVLVAVEALGWARGTDERSWQVATARDQHDLLAWDLARGRVGPQHPLYAWLLAHGADEPTLALLRAEGVEHDIFGVNFYPWSAVELSCGADGTIHSRVAARDGHLLADVLRRAHEHVGLPLFVTETSATGTPEQRAAWMDQTIAAVASVCVEGVPVVGYTWFPILSMIEWDYRASQRPLAEHLLHLGLWDSRFAPDGTLVRHETALVERYRAYARQG